MLGEPPLSERNPDCRCSGELAAPECCKADCEHGAKVEPERCFSVAVVAAAAPAHLSCYKHLQSPASNLPLLLLCVGDEETRI